MGGRGAFYTWSISSRHIAVKVTREELLERIKVRMLGWVTKSRWKPCSPHT